MEKRLYSLDIMKGIAIFCVVLGHIPTENENVKMVISLFHMPIFFIISGYLAYSSMENCPFYLKMLKKKVRKLLIPFIIWSGIAFLLNMALLFCSKNLSIFSAIDLFQEIFFEARSVWFLVILFFAFILGGGVFECWNLEYHINLLDGLI